jgi:hypothetical protein
MELQIINFERKNSFMKSVEPVLEYAIKIIQKVADVCGMRKK